MIHARQYNVPSLDNDKATILFSEKQKRPASASIHLWTCVIVAPIPFILSLTMEMTKPWRMKLANSKFSKQMKSEKKDSSSSNNKWNKIFEILMD